LQQCCCTTHVLLVMGSGQVAGHTSSLYISCNNHHSLVNYRSYCTRLYVLSGMRSIMHGACKDTAGNPLSCLVCVCACVQAHSLLIHSSHQPLLPHSFCVFARMYLWLPPPPQRLRPNGSTPPVYPVLPRLDDNCQLVQACHLPFRMQRAT
jgi:hypothetical protein